jgi:hypothetical protein
MTALERAKVFVQSRAAKTALRILPLALATVVSVSTKAHATTQPVFSGSFSTWSSQDCSSGGTAACLNPSSFSANPPVPYMTNGSQSSGIATGTYVARGAGPATLTFLMSGNGTGDLTAPTTVQFDVNIKCPSCAASDTFSFAVFGQVYNQTLGYNGSSPLFTGMGDSLDASGTFTVPSPGGTLQDWQTYINFSWTGNAGEIASFDVTQLAIYPPSATSTVPEPGSLLLALSGLPFIGRLIRRKR